MIPVYTPSESRESDRRLICELGIPGVQLMETAARGVTDLILQIYTNQHPILVICGTGNNGGDGFAVLRQLHEAGLPCEGFIVGDSAKVQGDALYHLERSRAAGVPYLDCLSETFDGYGLIVDAIFGTGLNRPLREDVCSIVRMINAASAPVIAVDIPSGIDGASGAVLGEAVRAAHTITFHAFKPGLLLYPGREYAGSVHIHPIADVYPFDAVMFMPEDADIYGFFPERKPDSHKGNFGRGLLIAGSENLAGAALMSAKSCLRSGVGLLTAAVPRAVRSAFYTIPEVMCCPCGSEGTWTADAQRDVLPLLRNKTAAAVGCGMGKTDCSDVLRAVLNSRIPAVIDADGLNLLSAHPELYALLHSGIIITPHPAEMARLTGFTVEDILKDPVKSALDFSKVYGCCTLLKSAVSVVTDGRTLYFNTTGNPGLSKGGSGDVLTGIILALLCQGFPPLRAGIAGAYLLGTSADRAMTLLGNRMLLASDVIDAITL